MGQNTGTVLYERQSWEFSLSKSQLSRHLKGGEEGGAAQGERAH